MSAYDEPNIRTEHVQSDSLTDELRKRLAAFQNYTASWGYPMNQDAHYRGLNNVTKDVQTYVNSKLLALKESMPEKRKLFEPVTKRPVNNIGDKVWIDIDADLKGSLAFIQDNGYNQAIDTVTALIDGVIGENYGG